MKFRIETLKNKNPDEETGYAFIDENDRCIIIVFGEARKKIISQILSDEIEDKLHIKYKTINLR